MIKDKKYIRLLINKTLFSKYGDSKEELNKQYIYSLLKDKKCHYSSLFKDYLIYDYIDEFLKKNYLLDELKAKLPQISIYYYHYLSFFVDLSLNIFIIITPFKIVLIIKQKYFIKKHMK